MWAKEIIKRQLNTRREYATSHMMVQYDSTLSKHNPVSKLTADELRQIADKWGWLPKRVVKEGILFYESMKGIDRFDVEYIPSNYFHPFLLKYLNPPKTKQLLAHKSLSEVIYNTGIIHPQTILRTYGGVYLDSGFHTLTQKEALNLVAKSEGDILFKPAQDTSQGKGVKLYTDSNKQELIDLMNSGEIFGRHSIDFVLQRLASQSISTKKLNPSSLNCFRINTLNLKSGGVTICTRGIKCGPAGSVVDNIGEGKKGVFVGVSPEGELSEFGYYGNGEKATSHNGIIFKGYKIPHFDRIEEAAIKLHSYVDKCKIIGWDLALDADNQPILIEANLICPGTAFEQLASGPIFKGRTDQVIEYIKSCK